ncbi:MAG: NfeD family protein [Actinomycetota bacterium]
MITNRSLILIALAACLAFSASPLSSAEAATTNVVDFIEVDGFLDEVSAAFVIDQIQVASDREDAALVIRDNTRGVLTAIGPLASALRESSVPVVLWAGGSLESRLGQEVDLVVNVATTRELLEKLVAVAPSPYQLRFHKMSLLDRMKHSAARPVSAYLLLLLGLFGVMFELYNPGIGAAAVSGGVTWAFGFQALTVLPTSWWALALFVLGLVCFQLDLRRGAFGLLTAAGIGSCSVGSALLFDAPLRLPVWSVVVGVAMVLVFFLSVMTAAIRARTARPIAGADSLVGTSGTARTDISPTGQVMARGTLWRARTLGAAIAQGTEVRIRGVSGLILIVESLED